MSPVAVSLIAFIVLIAGASATHLLECALIARRKARP